MNFRQIHCSKSILEFSPVPAPPPPPVLPDIPKEPNRDNVKSLMGKLRSLPSGLLLPSMLVFSWWKGAFGSRRSYTSLHGRSFTGVHQNGTKCRPSRAFCPDIFARVHFNHLPCDSHLRAAAEM
jgi:hypothetical protein